MLPMQSRRLFATRVALAGAAGLIGGTAARAADDLPETRTVRLPKIPGICIAPGYVAEELLRAEGFTDIQYVDVGGGNPSAQLLARGELDFAINFVGSLSSRRWMRASRSACSRASTPAASSCSRRATSAGSPT